MRIQVSFICVCFVKGSGFPCHVVFFKTFNILNCKKPTKAGVSYEKRCKLTSESLCFLQTSRRSKDLRGIDHCDIISQPEDASGVR